MWLVYVVLFILGAAAAVAALGLYLSYAAACGLLAASVAIVAYGMGLPAVYLATLGDVLGRRPAGLAPPETWPQPPDGADPAVLQYFYGPARADARHAMTVAYQRSRDWWGHGAAAVGQALRADLLPFTVPAALGGAAGMAVGAAAGTLLTAGCALVYLLAVALGTAGTRAARRTAARGRLGTAQHQEHPHPVPVLRPPDALSRVPLPRAGLRPETPRRAPGTVRHYPPVLPLRAADENTAAVRLGPDDGVLPALRRGVGARAR